MAELDLQALLDAATGDTPADRQTAVAAALTEAGATGADVEALLNEVIDKFETLNAGEPEDAESLLGLELLADVAGAARQVQTDLAAESARVREVRDDLAARVMGPAAEPDTDGDTDSGETADTDTTAELVASGERADDVIKYAVDQSRLNGQSLIAAGGWCAPSERIWDLLPMLADARMGLIDLPEIAVTRGGIITMGGLDFRTVWAGNAGLILTEAQAETGAEKVFFRPTCPDESETRLDVIYSGITVGNLQDHAFPETTRQAVEGVQAVHAHRVNASTIARMVAASTPVDMSTAVGPSATVGVLNALELVTTNLRYGFRAPSAMTMEVVLPDWLHTVVRSDLALRATADGNPNQVTDQQIDAYFAARKAKVQWVVDWQDAFTTNPATGFGSVTRWWMTRSGCGWGFPASTPGSPPARCPTISTHSPTPSSVSPRGSTS